MLHEIYTASWANIWAAMSAISTTMAVLVAWQAMLRWRNQDELKVKMAFKQAVADYSYCLMHLPTHLQSPVTRLEYTDKCKELVDRLSVCHNAWLLTEGLMAKESDIIEAWEFIFTNHKNYLSGALSSLVLGAHCTTILNKRFVFK